MQSAGGAQEAPIGEIPGTSREMVPPLQETDPELERKQMLAMLNNMAVEYHKTRPEIVQMMKEMNLLTDDVPRTPENFIRAGYKFLEKLNATPEMIAGIFGEGSGAASNEGTLAENSVNEDLKQASPNIQDRCEPKGGQ
ncbi:hypothetical protein Ddc_12393 [Ditylenchus destructor]|nr:hypothetical protein Ddc_12393 [Ditylenchus destructor]